MKLYLYFLLMILSACSASPKTDNGTIRMQVLRGPSAVAFALLMDSIYTIDNHPLILNVTDSPEQMQAQLVKGEADIAVLPLISAANLYNKGVDYRLQGCPVWGTLYLVSRQNIFDNPTDAPIYLFGRGTTPDILARHYLSNYPLPGGTPSFNYAFPTAREVMQALLAGNAQTAVLAEPFLSMALRQDTSLHIVANLNRPAEQTDGYPQTALVISPEMEKYREAIDRLLETSCRFASSNPREAIRILEEKRIFPAGMLTPEGVERCMIDYRPACDVRKQIDDFLHIIYGYEPKALGNRMPEASFIPCHP